MFIQSIASVSQALLTPVIAIVATYVAWQQWQTNKQKLMLDRYDRRLRVYEEVRKILSIIARDADVGLEDLLRFRTSVSEADFLFGPEVSKYIDEVYTHGLTLSRWSKSYRDGNSQIKEGRGPYKNVADLMHAELTWLTEQHEASKSVFKKYLDISK